MNTAMARHILVATETEALDIKRRLSKGQAFDVLARKYSKCPSAKKGGDLGEVRRRQMVPSIDKVIFNNALRQTHGPIKSKFGYHLVQVYFRG